MLKKRIVIKINRCIVKRGENKSRDYLFIAGAFYFDLPRVPDRNKLRYAFATKFPGNEALRAEKRFRQ